MEGLFSSNTETGFSTIAQRLRGRRRRRRERWSHLYYSLALLCTALFARATSVTPPSFPQLVSEAQVIAQGTVTSIASRWVDGPQGRMINTFVDFAVEKTLKGTAPATLTLQFLGGTVGADTLHVGGMPEFKIGEQEILFVQNNGIQFCPLVRFGHGRYHVRTDAASHRQYVARNDNMPLTSTAEVQVPENDSGAAKHDPANALSPDAFAAQVRAEIAHPTTANHALN
jgi:hypothetical protein